ncbi:MAG: hypothetical protein CM15mP113_2020 [Pseudomonadota bacterium]|nr:MAG: hypothetical protein CM15mP113_2020 [Pseudomonadota bacterium]
MYMLLKKDENYIGIVTTRVGIGSTSEGLYFLGNGITGIDPIYIILNLILQRS